MRELTSHEAQEVDGGFLAALGAFVLIFTLPKIINDHKKTYGEWGQEWSQQFYDSTYPYDPNSNACYGPSCSFYPHA